MSKIKYILLIMTISSCIPIQEKMSKLKFNSEDEQSNPTTSGGQTQFVESRSVQMRFGDHKFLTNFLYSKFGSSSSNCKSTIKSNVWDQPKIFGASCDIYNFDDCRDLDLRNAMALSSTLRAGRMMKTCEELVDNNTCLDYFLDTAELDAGVAVSDANIQKAFSSFYPIAEKLSSEELTGISSMAMNLSTNRERWRHISLALCVSPEWQRP